MVPVTAFSVSTTSSATVDADRAVVWDALTDTELLPRLTPYLRSIDATGDRWVWQLMHIPLLGTVVSPTFTEVMTFDEPSTIAFTHDPTKTGEKVGVEGRYSLRDAADGAAAARRGTDVSIELGITVELPFPRLARPAVHAAMRAVVSLMGARFSANLVHHLRASA
jgi:carbon monoxide dehydrogenase subunit G